ncbi:MAG: DUF4097 family beta strand repeat-containing protein [Bifidobacteriaceae bacterium]|jgi:hypothetical protein|nr:DUF4097 family beta strand repeat-containing protein [Bifidobacteriaceae bacterium]
MTKQSPHPRHTRRLVTLTVAAALAVAGAGLLAGCGTVSLRGVDPESTDFELSGTDVTITSANSDMTVVPGDVGRVQVTRWVRGGDPSWEITHDMALDGGGATDLIELRVDCHILQNCLARYEITVPRGVTVRLASDNGDLTASGFADGLAVKSDNGDLDLSNLTCAVGIETDNGDIELRNVTGNVTVSTDNGSLNANRISSDQFTVDSDNADVEVSGLAAQVVRLTTQNGDLDVVMDEVPREVTVESKNADLDLAVPHGDYEVSIEKDHGDSDSQVKSTSGASNTITIVTENGDIDLSYSD